MTYLDIAERKAIVISVLLHCHKEILVVSVLTSSCVVVTGSIVRPVTIA